MNRLQKWYPTKDTKTAKNCNAKKVRLIEKITIFAIELQLMNV